ncbi:MAG: iron-containing alcohol dehydrogenase [Deltaproteobacteria bacterium]|nr:iron-containing alcohol dehydrogenase [Deltaproteobacteria bacterium]
MPNILFRTTPRILMGPGSIDQIGPEVKALKGKKVLIVTDPGIIQAGLLDQVLPPLGKAGIAQALFDGVEPDPPIEVVDQALAQLKKEQCDSVIGLGGGSSLDIAKLVAAMAVNPGHISDYFGVDLLVRPGLPLIAVPTTAGTGSEVTPIAILSDQAEHLKKGVVSSYLFPGLALLDPILTLGVPPMVTAFTGMDALIHAIEAFTSVNANSLTDHLAFRAIELTSGNLLTAYARGEDPEARSKMLEGSLLAGMAFANAGVTAVHAFAYPLGGAFHHISHGLANSIMLPHVFRFNMLGNLPKFAEISLALGISTEDLTDRQAAEEGLEVIEELMIDLNIPLRLRDLQVPEEAIPEMAQGVMKVTRLLANNPRRITLEDAERIYRAAW